MPWIDSGAALIAGVLLLALQPLLVDFYGMSASLLTFIGVANASYSVFGLVLGFTRDIAALVVLVAANLGWGAVCLIVLVGAARDASIFGQLHLAIEGGIVAGMGIIEWRSRHAILGRQGAA